jgi:hypothetical protein
VNVFRSLVAFSAAGLVLLGCTSPRSSLESPFDSLRTTAREDVTLRAVGSPGQSFTGTLNLDGARREISGTTPAEFPLEVCWMIAQLRKTGGSGTLSFQIGSDRRSATGCGLQKPGSACWFAYHDGEMRSRQ